VLFICLASLAAALVSIALSIIAASARHSRPDPGPVTDQPLLVVAGASRPGALDSSTVRTLAAVSGAVALKFRVGRVEGENGASSLVDSVRREFPGFDAVSIAAVTDSRRVAEPCLVASAAASTTGDPVLILAASARPPASSIRSIASVLPGDAVCSALPVRMPSEAGPFSVQADMERMSPVYFGLFGPVGVLPTMVMLGRERFERTIGEPLAMNRHSAGAAVHAACPADQFVPLPLPVSYPSTLAMTHLAVLSRVSAGRYALCCLSLAAAPMSLAAIVVSMFVNPGFLPLALLSLVMSICARMVAGAVIVRGNGAFLSALSSAALTPFTDFPALIRAMAAAGTRRVRMGAVDCRIHSNGLLSPSADRDVYGVV